MDKNSDLIGFLGRFFFPRTTIQGQGKEQGEKVLHPPGILSMKNRYRQCP